jgi:hypothetical protein
MDFSAQKKFNFSDIHIQEILYEISKLNISKSVGVGPDNIPVKLIKDSKDVVAPFLTIGIFPDDFKIGKIKSNLYKSGDRKERGIVIDLFLYTLDNCETF